MVWLAGVVRLAPNKLSPNLEIALSQSWHGKPFEMLLEGMN